MSIRYNPRKRAAFLLVIGATVLTSMLTRGGLANIRPIDALSLFAIGITVGAAIANFRRSFEQQ